MDWNSDTLHFLSQCFLHTLSPDPIPRRLAEASLCEASLHPHFSLAVLRLVSDPTVHDKIRHAAAVNFKNHLKAHWAPTSSSAGPTISDAEKDQIKSLIVSITLSAALKIQAQLVEALAVIGPALLPEFVSNLQNASLAGDYAVINGILVTANSMFEKFQCRLFTQTLLLDLNYCLDHFAKPLLEIFLKNATLIDSAANSSGGSAGALRPIFESQRLCCRILYSLNFQYLPVFFEEHMKECMAEFIKYLTTSYPVLESSADGLELVDELRAAVCQYLNLCMQHRGGEFQKYLNGFAFAVCNLLVNVSQSQTRDQVAVSGIKFLTTVSTSVHHNLFADEGVILIIFRGIVIPNVRLRDEDEKMFEMDYTEYIRRDMEGCDIDTRRWFAAELLKGIATNNKLQVSLLFSLWKQDFLSSFAMNPVANWKEKDCAIYLVVSLSTKRVCGNSAWTDLVDVGNFFQTVIAAELQSQDVNEFPMLKASALKFFTMFQNHIQKEVTSHFFPDLIRFLGAESNVVHSYAAISIEKLFLVKDLGGRLRYTSADFSPLVPVLMTNLFEALKFPESEQNQYVMKCILRVIGVAELSREFAEPCIARLTLILNEACENPVKSDFNHYLFESAVILVKQGCRKDTSLVSIFETNLLPTIQKILLGEQVTDFFRYAFELLHQFIELKRPSINSLPYVQFFEKLLSPESLDKASSDAHAFVCLLQLKQYLKKTSQELNQDGRLRQVLETFNKIDLQ